MIGYGAILVTELLRCDHHFLERTAAVGPGGVRMKITPDGGTHIQPALYKGLFLLTELLQVVRHLAVHRLSDHGGGLRASAGDLGPSALLLMLPTMLFRELRDPIGGPA